MLKNYFIIAARNLTRNKIYSIINIFGLAISIAACVLIGLFVWNEISFDNQAPDKANIYRLNEYIHYDGSTPQLSAAISPPIPLFLKSNHAEIENFTRVFPATPDIYPAITLEYGGKKITTSQMACTDPSFASMFGINIVEGDKKNLFHDKNSIVLTKSMAFRIFGTAGALNKTLLMHTDDTTSVHVSVCNVIADFPKTSHIQAEGLLPVPEYFPHGYETNYGVLSGPVYLQLRSGANLNSLQAKFTETIHAKNKFIDMQLQPLKEVHTQSSAINYDFYNFNKIDGKYIGVFIIMALAIFAIACINFINFSIAVAGYRGKEIAVKKIMGARRAHIVWQVLAETFVSVFTSVLVSVMLVSLSLPLMNHILNRELSVTVLYHPAMIGVYVAVLLSTTFLAGLYPAWLISSSKIEQALKSKILFNQSGTALRNIMVTGQFVIAIVFIVSPLVFLQQLNYLKEKDLGYSYNQVIKIPLNEQAAGKLSVLRSELAKIKGVQAVTNGYMELGANGALFGIDYTGTDGTAKSASVNFENVAPNYVSFFGMTIIAGHDFSANNASNEYLVNEALVKQIGYKNPVGKPINLSGGWPPGIIAGVLKDFNYGSLHTKIEPLVLNTVNYIPAWQKQLYVKINTTSIPATLKEIEATMQSIAGYEAVDIQFLDAHFKEIYNAERQAGTMITIIGGLAILIACLGLFSLTTFMTMRRTKEIGIRKVVGASVNSIVFMLSKDFLKLILIAMLIAFPLAWWAMNEWLQSFAYRIHIGADVFLMAGSVIVFISIVTISFQSVKAAVANPVKSLRSE